MVLIKTIIFHNYHSFFLQQLQKLVKINLYKFLQKQQHRQTQLNKKKNKKFLFKTFLKNPQKNKNKNKNFCLEFVKIRILNFNKI